MENKSFNYYLPQLGRLSIKLYPYATQCYNLLDNYGHIERLKNIDQLGVIRNVYQGAHHPRWEYVVLQLNLINRLKNLNDAKGLGLSSSKRRFLDYNPSGAEILQLWVLLLNSGHLPGTFASERALLRTFKESSGYRGVFKSGLRPNIKELFNKILDYEDIYSVHKVLISFYLDRYKRFKDYDVGGSKFVDFLQKILDFYLFEPDEKSLAERRFRLKSTFWKIRQVSYLFLDSQYAPFPVNFDLSKIFLNLDDYYEDIFVEPESQIVKTLIAFDDLLSTSLYHSASSIAELGKHSNEVQGKFENKGFSRYSDIHKYLINESTEFEPAKFSNDDYIFQILFDLSLDNSLKNIFKKHLCFENEKKWNNLFSRNHCLLTFQSSANTRQYVVNLRLFKSSPQEKNMKILGHLLKNIVGLYFNLRKEVNHRKYETVDKIFQRPFREIMLNILKYITGPELYFEFKDYGQEISVLPASGSKTAPNVIDSIFSLSDISKSREDELNGLKGALRNINHRGKLLISLAPILVYNNQRQILTDLDGFALGYSNNELKFLLVEAKNQKSSSGKDCTSQLTKSLLNLGVKTSESMDIFPLPEYKCVFSYFSVI